MSEEGMQRRHGNIKQQQQPKGKREEDKGRIKYDNTSARGAYKTQYKWRHIQRGGNVQVYNKVEHGTEVMRFIKERKKLMHTAKRWRYDLPLCDNDVVTCGFQPSVIFHITRMGAFSHIDGEHCIQEIAKKVRVRLGEEIFLDHDTLERPWFQGSDIAEGTCHVKKEILNHVSKIFCARKITQSTNLSGRKAHGYTCHPS